MNKNEIKIIKEDIAWMDEKTDLVARNKGKLYVTVKSSDGYGVNGILIAGISGLNGEEIFTDDTGLAIGYATAGSNVIGIKNYADIPDNTQTITVTAGERLYPTVTISHRNFVSYTTSQSIRFSPSCKSVSYSLCGGGGGGGGVYTSRQIAGGGGGGGYTVLGSLNQIDYSIVYSLTVGGGGEAGRSSVSWDAVKGKNGGSTSFNGTVANGGGGGGGITQNEISVGGIGNGNGGRGETSSSVGSDGSDGDNAYFSSFYATIKAGGGGAGGPFTYDPSYIGAEKKYFGGKQNGSNSVALIWRGYSASPNVEIQNGTAAIAPGGGGCGGTTYSHNTSQSMIGGSLPGASGGGAFRIGLG